MKSLLSQLLLISGILFISSSLFSQKTYTINYATSGLPTALCNVFNVSPAYVINGFEHDPASGGVKFSGTTLQLPGYTSGAVDYGTAYAIKFPFKKGYTYSITLNIYKKSPDPVASPMLDLGIFNVLGNPITTHAGDCGAVSQNAFSYYQQGTIFLGGINFPSATNFNIPAFTPAASYNYLSVLAYGGSTSNDTTVINSITITENISLNITSSLASITCGATTPITFTINNPNAAAGITGYTWNLGAIPNGWKLPNGTAAPATYATSTNTLTLTPVCGSALKPVTASATANGNTYNASNSVTTVINPPTLAINGLITLCSGSTQYTITGVPCNSTIAWVQPPAGAGTLSPTNSSPTTLTYGGTRTNFTLTANVTSCSVLQPVTLPIHVGPYTSSDYILNGNNGSTYWCPNTTYTFGVGPAVGVPGAGGSNYVWTVPTGWTTVYNPNGNYIEIKSPSTPNPPTGTLSVTFVEPCGSNVTKNYFLAYSSSQCGASSSPYSVTPNPASTTITIACISLQTYCNITQVQITDMYGSLKSSQTFGPSNQQVQMPVSFLANGNYIAKTYDGTTWYSNQFVVQH